MKLSKLILSISILSIIGLTTSNIKAQSSSSSNILAGGGLAYATDINTLAVFAKGVYQFTDEWEGSAGLNYFFPKESGLGKIKWFSFDFDGHYVFAKEDGLDFYALAGLNIITVSTPAYELNINGNSIKTGSKSYSDLGVNLGAGGRYQFSDNLYGLGEAKYTVGSGGYLQLSAGVLYKF